MKQSYKTLVVYTKTPKRPKLKLFVKLLAQENPGEILFREAIMSITEPALYEAQTPFLPEEKPVPTLGLASPTH